MSSQAKVVEAPLTHSAGIVSSNAENAEEYGGTETVLLVEDDAFVREVTAKVMGFAGYLVLAAKDAAEALQLYGEHGRQVKLLLTDMILPGQSGRSLAENLRFQDPGLRVLFVTGYAERASVPQPEQCLLKPYSALTILRRVRGALNYSKAGGELRRACDSAWPAGFAAGSG